MGLLTDPSTGKGRLTKFLLKYHNKLCFLLVIAGVICFGALAHPSINASTYFSENALLPGLVKSQFREDREAALYYEEVKDELKKYEDTIPYPWLLAKFRQIGLDTYTHNFSLKSPLSKREQYFGKNVYGILRSSRGSSSEALVLSAPFRTSTSIHPSTAPSVAIMLAFAKYAKKEKYWAKDIIFLITEYEQLGIQAWLEAYYGITCGNEGILNHGDLKGRGGAIQAAINLELHSDKIAEIDIKIEGLNGQLPNLDLFNLASKMCSKEGVFQTFKNRGSIYSKDPIMEWWNYFKNLLAMMATQATGIPNGNHGLFHRFGIQAVTLEGLEYSNVRSTGRVKLLSIGRILEGIFRSLNNLLEKFHQSFFFYLLPSSDRYISIGLYIPSVCLIAGALFIKACAKWLKLQDFEDGKPDSGIPLRPKVKHEVKIDQVLVLFFSAHCVGFMFLYLPEYLSTICIGENWESTHVYFPAILICCTLLCLLPNLFSLCSSEDSMNVLNILCLLELGTTLICIFMTNFSLGLFCSLVNVPAALCIEPTSNRFVSLLQKGFWLMVHPAAVLLLAVTVNTCILFPEETLMDLSHRIWEVSGKAVIYSITDLMIYGNWLYTVVISLLLPNWFCFWTVTFTGKKIDEYRKEKKE